MPNTAPEDSLLTPAEVAVRFKVHVRTVGRWEKAKKITAVRTPGGHRRYRESEVRALLAAGGPPPKPRQRKAQAPEGGS